LIGCELQTEIGCEYKKLLGTNYGAAIAAFSNCEQQDALSRLDVLAAISEICAGACVNI
jgi:hypothetical protein